MRKESENGADVTTPAAVWIVLQDAYDSETVLGVFGDMDAADAYADSVRPRFPDGAIFYTCYPVGWTHDENATRYKSR